MKVNRGALIYLNRLFDAQVFRRSEKIPLDAFEIVSVGELNANKNHKIIIETISKLKEKNKIHYVIAGIGDNKELLERITCKLNVNLHILGYRKDVANLYMSADAYAFPSIREGLGMAALEGMASGLPLICSDNRGAESYATKDNSIMCNTTSVDDFAKAIITLFNDSLLCSRLGENGRITANMYSIDFINELMNRIYFK